MRTAAAGFLIIFSGLVPAHAQSTDLTIEIPFSVETLVSAADPSVPRLVAVTSTPTIRSNAAESGLGWTVSPTFEVQRDAFGESISPTAPFRPIASVGFQCGDGVELERFGELLGSYQTWAVLWPQSPAPDKREAQYIDYFTGGAPLFPEQTPSPGSGSMQVDQHVVSARPVIRNTACGPETVSYLDVDVHEASVAARGGDVSFQQDELLARFDIPMREAPLDGPLSLTIPSLPRRTLQVTYQLVDAEGPNRRLRVSIYPKRDGVWPESLRTEEGETWRLRMHMIALYRVQAAAQTDAGEDETQLSAVLNVDEGTKVVQLGPDGQERDVMTAPAAGSVQLRPGAAEFLPGSARGGDGIVRVPPASSPHTEAPRTAAPSSAQSEPPDPPLRVEKCSQEPQGFRGEGQVCVSLGTDASGAIAVTSLLLGGVPLGTAGLPFVELDGERHTVTPDTLTEEPFAWTYHEGGPFRAANRVTVATRHEIDGARFEVWWVAETDDDLQLGPSGRHTVFPLVSWFRSARHDEVRLVSYYRPGLAVPARSRVSSSGQQIRSFSVWATQNLLMPGERFQITDEGAAARPVTLRPTLGQYGIGAFWALAPKSQTVIGNWTGTPSADNASRATQPILGDDVVLYKDDLFEGRVGSSAPGVGPLGILLQRMPFTLTSS